MSRPCTNAKSVSSANDRENKCASCIRTRDIDKVVSGQKGMWFSFYRDPTTGKTVFKDRNPESANSKRIRGVVDPEESRSEVKPQEVKMKTKPRDAASSWGIDDDDFESPSRQGSWSSHGHVEL